MNKYIQLMRQNKQTKKTIAVLLIKPSSNDDPKVM